MVGRSFGWRLFFDSQLIPLSAKEQNSARISWSDSPSESKVRTSLSHSVLVAALCYVSLVHQSEIDFELSRLKLKRKVTELK